MNPNLLEQLLEISRRMAETRVLAPLLDYAMDVALKLVDAERGYLVLLDDHGNLDFRVRRDNQGQDIDQPEGQISHSVLNKVTTTGEPVVLTDAMVDPSFQQAKSVVNLQLRSVMCVPLITNGKTIGAIYVENRSLADIFEENALKTLTFFGAQAAVAIENAILNDQLEERVAARTVELEDANRRLQAEVNERRRSEQALRDQEEQLSLVTDGLPALIAYISADLHYLYVNKAYADWFSLSKDDLIGQAVQNIMETSLYDSFMPYFEVVLSGEQVSFEDTTYTDEEEPCIMLVTFVPHIDASGNVKAFFVLQQDITELRQVEEALYEQRIRHLNEMNQLKDEFVQIASHDLKAPIGIILGYASLLQDSASITEPLDIQCIEQIITSGQRMNTLIEDLLDVSRINIDTTLALEEIDIDKFVADSINSFKLTAQDKNLELLFYPNASGLVMQLDSGRMTQVMNNLISNAIKYTPEGGCIEIRTEKLVRDVVIIVRDTGLGIPEEDLPHLFEKFFRVSRREHMQEKGTGLGLSIVKGIVEQHSGNIQVESTLGEGTAFYISLPIPS